MQISTDALVIRERSIEGQDRLLTLLTSDSGVFTAYAKGAKKLRGQMTSATEFLCYSDFEINSRGDSRFVDKAESRHVFFGLRQEVSSLSLATYFCQLCGELISGEEGDDAPLRLMLNSLYVLEKGMLPKRLLKAVFELRLLTIAGYMPDLTCCSECGDTGSELYFSPDGGCCYCKSCAGERYGLLSLSRGVYDAMLHVTRCPDEKLFSFRLSENGEKELGVTAERYLLCQVEKMLPALEYYKTFGEENNDR